MINLYYVGRIVKRQKNFHQFIDLLILLIENNKEFCFSIFGVGDTKLLNKLLSLSNDRFKIVSYGYQADWINLIPDNAIQIFLSEYEGCPLALLEAYKNGKKNIIVLNSPGLVNYVSKNCVFSNIDDIAQSLIENQDLYNYNNLTMYFDQNRHSKEVINCFNMIFNKK